MKNIFLALALFIAACLSITAQQVKRTPFDVTNYVMDVSLTPVERKLTATVDVTFVPGEDTRSVSFELNGSLKVDSITRLGVGVPVAPKPVGRPQKGVPASTPPPAVGGVTFVQD